MLYLNKTKKPHSLDNLKGSAASHLEHDLVLGLLAGAALCLDLIALLLLILLLAKSHSQPAISLTPDVTKIAK